MTEIKIPTTNTVGVHRMKMSLSTDNEYIPIHSLSEGQKITKGNVSLLIYSFHIPRPDYRCSQYASFCSNLDFPDSDYNISWAKLGTLPFNLLGNRGMIVIKDDNPEHSKLLMTIAVKNKYLFNVDRIEKDLSKFVLLISKEFMNNPEYFKVFRNIKRLYIDKIADKIDIIYANDIMSLCFNDVAFKPKKFKTLDEALEYTNGINSLLLNALKSEVNAPEPELVS